MGRSRKKTKWRVAAISQRDVQQAEDLLTELPDRSPSFVRRFLEFLTLNKEMSSASVLAGFVGQLANCRLKWTSIAVYLKQAVDFLRGQDAILPSDRSTISRLQKAVHLRAADCDLRQAAAADVGRLREIVAALLPSKLKAGGCLLLCTGARWSDVRRLRRKQICVSVEDLHIEFRVMKNRRRLKDRITIHFPRYFCQGAIGGVRKGLRGCGPEDKPWGDITTGELNAALSDACSRLDVPRVTTYSFRHEFVRRARAYTEVTETRVEDLTGHCGSAMIRSHYAEKIAPTD